MPRYAITERAGPFVATYRNTGVGTILELTEHQAAHELRLGTLLALSPFATPKVEIPHGTFNEASARDEIKSDSVVPARKQKRVAS